MSATPLTLTDAVWPASRTRPLVRNLTLVLGGSLVLAASAQLQIPFYPVPFTMQTFVVLVIGLSYGPRLAGATVAAYLAEGAAGLPVFAGFSGGAAILGGATAGYLWGFLAAAVVMGLLAERGWDRSPARTLGAMLIGTAIIFALGLAWLGRLFGWDVALDTGLVPFVWSESAKIGLAVATVPAAWRLVGRE